MIDAALSGLPSGAAYALLGVAVVLLYRMAGVLNFSIAVFGAFGAFIMVSLFERGLPFGLAIAVGVLAGLALSAAMGAVMAALFPDTDPITRSVVTIGMAISLFAVAFRIFGDRPRSFPPLFPSVSYTVSGVSLKLSGMVALGLASVLAFAIWLFLRRTRIGVQVAAMSTRSTTAELLGIPVRSYTVAIWALAGAIATMAPILAAPTRQADFTSLGLLVVPALAAALLGSFHSLGLTVVAGLGIGVLEAMAVRWPAVSTWRTTLPFFVILVVLLWRQRGEVWDEAR
ncbi:MAG TPA: branched-chain amino acid ABC transporter permease [Acidimicrobiales bacterium]|nr:branched-chain amino acid ABC transporter permease [Acidimicrobiales bacterium]